MKAKIAPWINSNHPQNTVITDEAADEEFERLRRQCSLYKDLSDDADKAMASAIVLGTLLFGVIMIVVTMYRGGMILI